MVQHEHVRAYTNTSLIVKEGFGLEDGLFSGYKEDAHAYDRSSGDYELDAQGYAKIDDTPGATGSVGPRPRDHLPRA